MIGALAQLGAGCRREREDPIRALTTLESR
jgi:hypothetical protein